MTTEIMTNEQMINWIDNADYKDLLRKWRFAPAGDPFFQNNMGIYYAANLGLKAQTLTEEQKAAISKDIGWTDGTPYKSQEYEWTP